MSLDMIDAHQVENKFQHKFPASGYLTNSSNKKTCRLNQKSKTTPSKVQ